MTAQKHCLEEILPLCAEQDKDYIIGRIFACGTVCTMERLPDRCVQRRGGGLAVSLVSRIFCIYEGKRHWMRNGIFESGHA